METQTLITLSPIELEGMISRAVTQALSENKTEEKSPLNYLTRKEVCDIFGISKPTVHTWINEGILTPYHLGGRTYFKQTEVLAAPQSQHLSKKRKLCKK